VVTGAGFDLRIDGAQPLSLAAVHAVEAAGAEAEDSGFLAVEVSGAPDRSWISGLDVALVTKWERALRRLERLNAMTVAVASGAVGGMALDVLLATDYRIATPDTRLLVALDGAVTWPGMALYRLVQQAGAAPIRRAVLFGHPITVTRAVALSLVHEVTEAPAGALAAMAATAALRSGRELAIRRQLMQDAGTTSFEDALGAHLAACDRARRQAPSGAGR
jgi:isomerase DpgB